MRYEKGEHYDETIDELVRGLELLEEDGYSLLDQLKLIDKVHDCGGYLNSVVYKGVMDASLGSPYHFDHASAIYKALGEEPLENCLIKQREIDWGKAIERGEWDFKNGQSCDSFFLTYINLLVEAIQKKYGCEGRRVSTLDEVINYRANHSKAGKK